MIKRVVIVGGGFGGLETALRLRDLEKKIEIVLISKNKEFIFKPFLYRVACSRGSFSSISINLKKILHKKNIKFYNEEVVHVKPLEQAVVTITRKINFDYLIWTVGSVSNDRNIEGVSINALKLQSKLDAIKIRKNLANELEKSKHYNQKLKVIICGGGITGVQLASQIADKTRKRTSVSLIETSERILKAFGLEVSQYATKVLKKKGINIITNKEIKEIDTGRIQFKEGEPAYAGVIIWCGGIKPNPINYKTGLRTNDKGGIMINEHLQSSHPLIYAVGDCSYQFKNPKPMTAQTAINQGEVVAYNIHADIQKKEKKAYEGKEHPYIISLGKTKAIMIHKKIKKSFFPIIIKNLVKTHYIITRRFWIWPLKKITLK